MKHMRQPSMGGVPEYNDHHLQSTATVSYTHLTLPTKA